MNDNNTCPRRIVWEPSTRTEHSGRRGTWVIDPGDLGGLTMSQVGDLANKGLVSMNWYLDDQYDRFGLSLSDLETWRDALTGYLSDLHEQIQEQVDTPEVGSLFAEQHARRHG